MSRDISPDGHYSSPAFIHNGSSPQNTDGTQDVEKSKQQQIQPRPSIFPNLFAEVVCILVCSAGQLMFSWFMGNAEVDQLILVKDFNISSSHTPWFIGSFLLGNGVSVSISGSLLDLVAPRGFILGAFTWLTLSSILGAATAKTAYRWIFFLLSRTMQGLALGSLISGSISILGRLYHPGLRKTRVFALMAAFPPIGFSVGTMQGAALHAHQEWVFGSTAIFTAICTIAAFFTIPSLQAPEGISFRDFDIFGATFLVIANTLILFGITQGPSAQWAPYTYSLIIVGCLFLGCFPLVERYVRRPLLPPQLWHTKGFTPLIIAFGLSFGTWVGAWLPNALQYFLLIEQASPIRVALYFLPNAVVGITAVFVVQKIMHLIPSQWIFTISMLANAISPALFLPIKPSIPYWALGMPGIALGTFGPDMSFVAASIFITSSVPKSYQGAAGSLLITVENLASAIFVSVAGSIGTAVSNRHAEQGTAQGYDPSSTVSLGGLRAIWWFAMGVTIFASILVALTVRIKKAVEDDHVAEAAVSQLRNDIKE